jgi:predicted TIM-barrel fold metal-dependent hydrolase
MTALLDAHLHFWDPTARHHDWLAGHPPLQRRFGPQDLDAGGHELTGAVFVQADCRDAEALDEVRWVADLARDHSFIRGIVAYAPVHRGRAAEQDLAVLAAEPLVVGVRWLLQGRPGEQISGRSLTDGLRLLAEWGLTFDVCATHDQLAAVASLVEACPQTAFVLDHLGKPPVAGRQLDPWRDDLARIASLPNAACKLSGLATEAAPGWTAADVRPYLEHALEVFGPQRCMIASDWPVATLATTVEHWFAVVLEVIAQLPAHQRAAVLSGTAAATYGLAGPSPGTARNADAGSSVRR